MLQKLKFINTLEELSRTKGGGGGTESDKCSKFQEVKAGQIQNVFLCQEKSIFDP